MDLPRIQRVGYIIQQQNVDLLPQAVYFQQKRQSQYNCCSSQCHRPPLPRKSLSISQPVQQCHLDCSHTKNDSCKALRKISPSGQRHPHPLFLTDIFPHKSIPVADLHMHFIAFLEFQCHRPKHAPLLASLKCRLPAYTSKYSASTYCQQDSPDPQQYKFASVL